MKKIILFSFAMLAIFSSVAAASVVYMKNGETLQARSAWREGDTVYVLVNRDIMLDFPKEEVDFRKTRIKTLPRSSRLLDQVLEVSAMRKQIDSFASSIKGSEDSMPDELVTIMKESFNPSESWKTMRQQMARDLDEKTLSDVLLWYRSPTGSKIARIESEHDPDRKQKMEVFFDREATEETKAKIELCKQIEKVTGLADFEVRLVKKSVDGVISAMPAEIRNRPEVRQQMKGIVGEDSIERTRKKYVATLAYSYRDLSVEEVKEVLEFERSDSGRKYCEATKRGIGKVMDRFMARFKKKLHTTLVELMKANQ